MFDRTRKIIRYAAYVILLLALILAYLNNREYVNNIFPAEDLAQGMWYGFKNFIAKLDVVPEYVPAFTVKKQQAQQKEIVQPEIKNEQPHAEVTYTATQKKAGKELTYGYDKNFNLVTTNDGVNQQFFEYSFDGVLQKITAGDRIIKFNYNPRGQLTRINDNDATVQFRYDINSWLKSVEYQYEKLLFQFDSLGQLFTFQRGVGYETKFTYEKGRLSAFVKDGTTTRLSYGQKNLLKGAVTDDSYLVLNYGKDDLLSYLAGAKYGLGETISYNTNDETVVSSNDDSAFTGEPEKARINALNLYLTCTKFKKLPVLFDPLAYVLYTNYFKQDIADYLVNNYVCDVVYGRKV